MTDRKVILHGNEVAYDKLLVIACGPDALEQLRNDVPLLFDLSDYRADSAKRIILAARYAAVDRGPPPTASWLVHRQPFVTGDSRVLQTVPNKYVVGYSRSFLNKKCFVFGRGIDDIISEMDRCSHPPWVLRVFDRIKALSQDGDLGGLKRYRDVLERTWGPRDRVIVFADACVTRMRRLLRELE